MYLNREVLQASAQATYGLDLPGAVRAASGLDLDLNGVCHALFGKEAGACFEELVDLLDDPGDG